MNGYVLNFYPTSLSLALWINPHARKDDELFFERYLRANDNVIDVGANIGSLALRAASIVKSGRVFAVEPHPQISKYLAEKTITSKLSDVNAKE